MNSSLNRILILTKRNLKEIIRDSISLIFLIGLPLLMEVLFYLIFHNLTSQFEMQYLVPGIIVFSQAFLTLFIGLLISIDRSTSFLTRLFVSKAKSYEFIISYILTIVPIVLIQSILFYVVGIIFDVSILKVEILYSILFSLITALFFICLGILFGSLFNERSIGGIASIIISGQSILSGMWFPTEGLSGTFVTIMDMLPFKNATILVQNSLSGNGDLLKPLFIILIYTCFIFIISIKIFKHKMKSR